MAFLLPYAILTQGVYTGIISTISTVTVSTCSVVKSIYTHQNPDVTKIIKELDIERRLELIEAVMKKIDQRSQKLNSMEASQVIDMVSSKINIKDDPIEICLKYLHESIKTIHTDLTNINSKVERHYKKWFNSWRTLNVGPLIETLRTDSNLLDARFDDLTKISIFLANI